MSQTLQFHVPDSGSELETSLWYAPSLTHQRVFEYTEVVFFGSPHSVEISNQTGASAGLVHFDLSWDELVRAAMETSFSFLIDEPDIYGDTDGEPV